MGSASAASSFVRRLTPTGSADPHPPLRGTFSQWEKGSVMWVSRGINGVPAVVVEGKWLISGGQPAGVFEEALRGMAGEA